MQVVDALEIVLDDSIVVLNHLDDLLDSFHCLSAFHMDLELPGALFNPELERTATSLVKEILCLREVLLGNKQLQIKLGEVVRNRRVVLVHLLVRGHVLLCEGDGEWKGHRGYRAS